MTAPAEWVWLARIRRPQGRKGEVFADILTDFPEKFSERRRLYLLAEGDAAPGAKSAGSTAPPETTLMNHWLHKGGIVLHFDGVDSITAAEQLAGKIIAIPRTERAPLGENEVYIGDLIGCTLVDMAGTAQAVVGQIEDIDQAAGPVPLLVIRGAAGEVLIPFAKSYLRRLDVENKRVEMSLPEGLVDLNA